MGWRDQPGRWVGLATAWVLVALIGVSTLVVPGLWGLLLSGVLVAGLGTWLVGVPMADRLNPPLRRLQRALATIAGRSTPADSSRPTLDGLVRDAEQAAEETARGRLRTLELDASLAVLADAVAAPLLVTDPSGRVLLSNIGFSVLLAPSAKAVAGRPLESVFPRAEALAMHNTALNGETARSRLRVETPAGLKTFEVTATPIARSGRGALTLSERPAAVLLTFADVSELATAVELKTDFVANASHEFRTPVASLRAALETLDSPIADDPETAARVLGMAQANLARLEELMRDLLDLARLESPDAAAKPVPVTLASMADRLRARFEDACEDRGVALRFAIDPALLTIRTDPSLLELILSNLIDNATKFSPEGGTVLIEASPTLPDTPGDRAGVMFRVVDRGTGIPLNQQQRIFERFYQIEDARTGVTDRRGTGLGLAIVKHALRALGGSIRVESVWQEGTTMTVHLPRVVPTTSDAPR